MTRFTVHIDDGLESISSEYVFDTFDTKEGAENTARTARIAYPDGSAWVEEVDKTVDDRGLPLDPMDEPLYVDGNEDTIRDCEHHWQKAKEGGLFHCINGCGIRSLGL